MTNISQEAVEKTLRYAQRKAANKHEARFHLRQAKGFLKVAKHPSQDTNSQYRWLMFSMRHTALALNDAGDGSMLTALNGRH